ncbi:MAG: DUF4347 domain-containing protein, partial [Betaproteobacteria bacterium]
MNPLLAGAPALMPQFEQRVIDANGEYTHIAAANTELSRHEVVFVDTATPHYQSLIDDIQANGQDRRTLEVVLLDKNTDGIAQISEFLATRTDIDALHIISHGSDAAFQLGKGVLDADALNRNAAQIAHWGDSLTANADLLIYGCDVAQSEAGRALIDALARFTGADVTASEDATGNALLGGNWDLEYRTGSIETNLAIDLSIQANWAYTLLNNPPVNTVPSAQTTPVNTSLVLSGANKFSVADAESGANPLEVTLVATHGTLTLSGTAGLNFSVGNGTANAAMTFQGTITNINTALNSLTYTPGAGYSGAATIQMTSNDLGSASVGNTTAFGASTSTGAFDKQQIATQVNVTANGTATSITAYLANNKDETVRYGIYTDVAGAPGALLTQGTIAVPLNGSGAW